MSWTAYKVVLRLLTPLHVGAGQLGNVQRARPYVPGKALWGALTARLTRDDPALGGDYAAVGCRVNDELAFSYLYPAIGENVDLWPWDGSDEFAWRYLGTYAATALDYDHGAAAEGTLHEVEFIAPTARPDRDGQGQPVSLVGYVFERMGSMLPWRQVLPRLQLGGERTYGWGRVEASVVELADGRLFDQWAIESGAARPTLRAVSSDARVLAHTLAADFLDGRAVSGISGSIEPLVGRETRLDQKPGFGAHIPQARVCWMPGATAPSEDTRVTVGPYGVWEAC